MSTKYGPRDDADWKIIEFLREDGRTSNKEIAERLGLSEANVAARLKWLRQHQVMVVTLQRDLYSEGFEYQCIVDVHVRGRQPGAVARELARMPQVMHVTLLVGKPEILVVCNARDRAEQLALVYQQIAMVKGVAQVEVHTALEVNKYQSNFANLSGT